MLVSPTAEAWPKASRHTLHDCFHSCFRTRVSYLLYDTSCEVLPPSSTFPSLSLAVPSSTPSLFFFPFYVFFPRKVQNVRCVGVAVVCFYNAFVGIGECVLCCLDILFWHCSKKCMLVEIVSLFFWRFLFVLLGVMGEVCLEKGYLTERLGSFLKFCAPTELSAICVYCKKQS